MKIEVNDFVQYLDGKRKKYGFVTSDEIVASDGSLVHTIKDAIHTDLVDEVKTSDIILNYGKEPDFDELKLEIYNQEYVVPVFGNVTEYRNVLEQERKIIKDTFEDIKDTAKIYDCYPTYVTVKHNKGKKVGCYKYNKKEEMGEITLMPQAFEKENLKQIIFHELGHAVWDRNVPNNYKAKWIRLYDKNMERRSIQAQEVKDLRADLINSGMPIQDYIKSMEDGELLKKVTEYIKDLYNLKIQHLNTLVQSGDDLQKYWPSENIELSDYNPFVSEYATESVEEFFAESFMFYNLNMNLPESVRKAITITLKVIGVITSEEETEESEDNE